MEITYRENQLTYEQYIALRESVEWKIYSKVQTMNALGKSRYNVVAFYNEKAIAMGRVIGDDLYYTIVDLVVMPSYQGKGIGRELIKHIMYYIESNLPEGGRVSVVLIAEKGKEGFYIKQGFKQLPNEFCGAAMRKVIYKDNIEY